MRLFRLVYASRVQEEAFGPNELERIQEESCTHNAKSEVTGLLVFGQGHFLHGLEGECGEVNAIYSSIARDPRHQKPTILECREIKCRRFDNVPMRLIVLSKDDPDTRLLRRHSTTGQFQPLEMSGASATELLIEMRKSVD